MDLFPCYSIYIHLSLCLSCKVSCSVNFVSDCVLYQLIWLPTSKIQYPCLFVSLQDSILFIEQHKSGFERPADVEFEDYIQGIKPATSDSSLNPPKTRAKLWPFSKKNKVNLLSLFTWDLPALSLHKKCSVSRTRYWLPFPSLLSLLLHLTT